MPQRQQQFKSVFCDLTVPLGIGAFAYGFWLAWRPLGFIIGGLALAALGVILGRSVAAQRRAS